MDDKEWTSLGLKAKLDRPYQQPNLYQLSQKWQYEQSEHHSRVIQLNAFGRKIHLVLLPDIEAFWKCLKAATLSSARAANLSTERFIISNRFNILGPHVLPEVELANPGRDLADFLERPRSRVGLEHPVEVVIPSPSVRRHVTNPSELPVHAFHLNSGSPCDLVVVHAKSHLPPTRICSVNTDEPCELLGLDLGESRISGSGCWGKRPGSDLGVKATLASLGSIDPFSVGIEGLWPVPPLLSVHRYRYPCWECRRTRLSPGLPTNSGGLVLLTGHTPLDTGCALQLHAARLDVWLCRNGSVGVYKPSSSASA
ncbi:hypothetical protein U1Q18_022611 [Sarracenia purpurea var. burkii]